MIFFRNFAAGNSIALHGRTVTEADPIICVGVTGDVNPIHLYDSHARSPSCVWGSPHGQFIFALSLGLAVYVIAPMIHVSIIAFCGSDRVRGASAAGFRCHRADQRFRYKRYPDHWRARRKLLSYLWPGSACLGFQFPFSTMACSASSRTRSQMWAVYSPISGESLNGARGRDKSIGTASLILPGRRPRTKTRSAR